EGSRDAPAMGPEVRIAARRADAAGWSADREGRITGHRRARARSRYVRRAQPANTRPGRQAPREMEQGRRARTRRAAVAPREGGRRPDGAGHGPRPRYLRSRA